MRDWQLIPGFLPVASLPALARDSEMVSLLCQQKTKLPQCKQEKCLVKLLIIIFLLTK